MSPITYFLLGVAIAVIGLIIGGLIGYRLRAAKLVGTLLVIVDPVDGDKYMQLEISRNKADNIYDQNEILLKVVEIVGPDKTAK